MAEEKNEEFKILDSRNHVRMRPGLYIGSTSMEGVERFVNGQWIEAKYVPALLKMCDELLDNAVDESIRTGFKHANIIDVHVEGDRVTVKDNGRGIPQDTVKDVNTGEDIPRPVAAWTRMNAGTSFTDERETIGANGVGSACTNFMSSRFEGVTRDGRTEVTVKCLNGADQVHHHARKCTLGSGTEVTFWPDWELLETDSFDEQAREIIRDRLWSLQMSFPEVQFRYCGKPVGKPQIKQYASQYADKHVSHADQHLSFFFAHSPDGWRTNSFVNGVHTRQGGAYVDWLSSEVIDELMPLIKRRHKIDVTKQQCKQGLVMVLFARRFTNPKFDSQTKERLTNTWGDCKRHAGSLDFKKIARKIADTPEIIDPIIEAQLAKKIAAERRAATLAQKKAKKANVPKHIKASKPGGICYIVEGDSAAGNLISTRDQQKHGGFPLRGVIMNTRGKKPNEIMKNKELSELVSVLDLDINDPESVNDMWYSQIGILVDNDPDGAGHIFPLLLNFFSRWPKLFEQKRIGIVRAPILIATKGNQTVWKYTIKDANHFKKSNPNWKFRYIKGLGSLTESEYSEMINNPFIEWVVFDNDEHLQTMFGDDSTPRKNLLKN